MLYFLNPGITRGSQVTRAWVTVVSKPGQQCAVCQYALRIVEHQCVFVVTEAA